MYCKNCGKEIDNRAIVCPYCGLQVQSMPVQETKTNGVAIVGFIFSFFFPLIGLICSTIGKRNSVRCGGDGRKLATAGIVISFLSITIEIILVIIYIFFYLSILY